MAAINAFLTRRQALRLAASGLMVASSGSACTNQTSAQKLTFSTGNDKGVYDKLGRSLATALQTELNLPTITILPSDGSVANLRNLTSNKAQITISAADAAENPGNGTSALAKMYDDYVQLLVRRDGPITKITDLAGKKVSVGAPASGVKFVADRILAVAGLTGSVTKVTSAKDLTSALNMLAAGTIDAMFWSGGLPTPAIASFLPNYLLRLVDLGDIAPQVVDAHPIYGIASIPANTYANAYNTVAVTTIIISDLLLVNGQISDDLAYRMLQVLFSSQTALVIANQSAASLDIRSAIETFPVPLHSGAKRYYQDHKK
jgi:TRAP transporter TAXI family solute receptor